MGTLAFDSLQYARRLRAAGVPEQQAEVQAELMAEAFGFYADNIVTRDYLDATLRAGFAEHGAAVDARFSEQKLRFSSQFGEVKTQLRILMLMVSATWLLVGFPILQDALGG
jgi:hypothetical protein